MRPSSTITQVARKIADALEAHKMEYAIGGAIAFSYWGVPRATINLDITVFVHEDKWPALVEILQSTGCILKTEEALHCARERGDFRAHYEGYRIDVYLPLFEFYDSVKVRRARVMLVNRPAWIISPEDLTVFKMLFFRTKDIADIERILAVRSPDFDEQYVSTWLKKLLTEDDERIKKWNQLVEIKNRS